MRALLYLDKIFLILVFCFILVGCSGKIYVRDFSAPSNKVNDSALMHKATMRPYTVNGKTYYPTVVEVGDRLNGIASWYGPNFHGKKTSNGENYNMHALTAAHKTLPMNTMVKVTNLNNYKTIIVRINDRGPFVTGRIIDLSKAAANAISMIQTGTAPVELEVVGFYGKVGLKEAKTQIYEGGNFMVQVGAFRNKKGATTFANGLKKQRYTSIIKQYILDDRPIYRVFLTGFRSEAEARDFTANIKGSFIVRE